MAFEAEFEQPTSELLVSEMRPMASLTVDRAKAFDAATVEALLDSTAVEMQSRGLDLWSPGQFGEDVRQTIANGDLYIGRHEGVVVGCFMLDDGSPRLTHWLVGQGRAPSRGVVGRLTVARAAAGRGFGAELLDAAGVIARERGIAYLRLECPAENEGLRRYYLETGFAHCGDNRLPGPNGEPWVSCVFERPTGVGSP